MNGDCAVHSEKIDRIEKNCEAFFEKFDIIIDKISKVKEGQVRQDERIKINDRRINTIYGILVGGSSLAAAAYGVLKLLL